MIAFLGRFAAQFLLTALARTYAYTATNELDALLLVGLAYWLLGLVAALFRWP